MAIPSSRVGGAGRPVTYGKSDFLIISPELIRIMSDCVAQEEDHSIAHLIV